MRESYNDYLHRKRKEAGLSQKEAAAHFGVSKFRYRRFERGYSVPKPEVVEKINAFYGEDFAPYLVGESSYPGEIKPVEESAFRRKVKEALRKRWVKLLCILLPILGLLSIPAAAVSFYWTDKAAPSFYSETYIRLQESVCRWGDDYSDPLGNTRMRIVTYELPEEPTTFFAAIKAPVAAKNIGDMQFVFTLRIDDESLLGGEGFIKLQYTWRNSFDFMVVNNKTGEFILQTGRRLGKDEFELLSVKERFTIDGEELGYNDVDMVKLVASYADGFFESFLTDSQGTGCFGDDVFDVPSFYEDILKVKEAGDNVLNVYDNVFSAFAYIGAPIGVLLCGASLALFVLAHEKEEEPQEEVVGEEPLPNNRRLPFLIGTSTFRILGSLLFLIGSVYVVLSLANRLGLISLVIIKGDPNRLIDFSSNLFFLGVFFLYILGLRDDFAHPRRFYIRTIAFGTLAFALALVQTFFGWSLTYFQNSIANFLLTYMPANFFMPIFLYHLCAMFLFVTPEWAHGKLLKLWRWLAVVPVLLSVGVFVYSHTMRILGIGAFRTLDYFLGADRFPYSFVTYCFLFGNFILRRRWIKRYGSVYLQGDVYAFYKNMTLCVPALFIGILELILYFIPSAHALGFGESYALLGVAVLMLFYRGYNDKNHLPALISSRVAYALGLILTYSVPIALVVLYLTIG